MSFCYPLNKSEIIEWINNHLKVFLLHLYTSYKIKFEEVSNLKMALYFVNFWKVYFLDHVI